MAKSCSQARPNGSQRQPEREATAGLTSMHFGEPNQRRVAIVFSDSPSASATLRESEARQMFLLKLSDGLRALADPTPIRQEATCPLRVLLGCDRVAYAETFEDEETVHCTAEDVVPGLPQLFGQHFVLKTSTRATSSTSAAASSSRIGMSRHDRRSGRNRKPPSRRSRPVVRLHATGKGRASRIGGSSIRPYPTTGRSLGLDALRETAKHTWAAVERACSEAALREGEQTLRRSQV